MAHSVDHVRTGFGLRSQVRRELKSVYASGLVDLLKASDHRLDVDGLEIRLAREFGFCYGVDRAVEYAYETRKKFPDRRIFLTGEIIHNPHVNERLRAVGVAFLNDPTSVPAGFDELRAEDIVIVPAFGLPVATFEQLAEFGCTLVDTTCGSVLNVWKRVERYGREGFTAVIHGKRNHEETLATASRASEVGGRYLIVRDMEEAEILASFIEGHSELGEVSAHFAGGASDGFEFDRDLGRIGLANQTTMLSSESLAIGIRLRDAISDRWGLAALDDRFRSFDTICSATQDRQDAVEELCTFGLDLMLVIGGFNSSNTGHLVEIAGDRVTAFHIEDSSALLSRHEILHQPYGSKTRVTSHDWLRDGPVRVGITSGASTPNNRVGEVVARVLELRGVDPVELLGKLTRPAPVAAIV